MRLSRGFTLIELMIAIAVVAILTAVALPSYQAYVQRSRVPPGLDALSAYATRMEQRYQDNGCYANTCTPSVGTSCGSTLPTPANFTITCSLTGTTGQGFVATATGTGPMDQYVYTIDNTGLRVTVSHPKGGNGSCWTTRGTTCDT